LGDPISIAPTHIKKKLGHPLRVYFFKEKGKVGTNDILLTNVEASTSTIAKLKIPQLWSHHKSLKETPELCAVKAVSILNSLGFKSVVKMVIMFMVISVIIELLLNV